MNILDDEVVVVVAVVVVVDCAMSLVPHVLHHRDGLSVHLELEKVDRNERISCC
jgi:hypothetical protein